jgi:hypothetical protein
MYTGPGSVYFSNIPPLHIWIGILQDRGRNDIVRLIKSFL